MDYAQPLLMRLFWVLVITLAVENGCNGCWEKERIALLQLKDSINFLNGTSLSSWEEDDYLDYCQWERVTCNSTTRRVIKLSLNATTDWSLEDYSWYLNASILLPFEYLQSLDLSRNRLHGFLGNEGIGILSNLSNLEELDLSWNYLENRILLSLNKLSNLKILNLAGNDLNGSISINGIGIMSNLSNLEELHLEYNELDNSILPSLNKLSNLKILNLAGNRLNRLISINEFNGLNNLKELDLSLNGLRSIITVSGSREESGILNKLEVLDLSHNNLNDTIWSIFRELSSIKTLDLSSNSDLHGAIHNKDLKSLNSVKNLRMDGAILHTDFLRNMRVIMTSIQALSLRYCKINPILSIKGLCNLKTLRELDITGTGFGGTLPWCLVNLTSLRLLDITSNHFTGNIARSPLINLTSIEYLAISNNDFEVPISFKSFFNHSKLKVVENLNNKLLEEEDFLATSPSFQLIGLRLSSSQQGKITGSFPHFLYHQHDLQMVELRQIGFSGKFPNWLLYNNTRMKALLLSSNSFGGTLLLPSLPMKTLLELEISNNHLEGFIPYETASYFPSLEFLNMSTNNFEGNIPSSFGEMTALSILDLSNNRLSGEIPVHLAVGCRRLEFLKLSNNNLKGPILPPQNNLTQLDTLYSDHNGFTEIPSTLSLSPLTWLNASANQLAGKIPGFIANMPLDLLAMAGNHLEGPIPIEFCQLNRLWLLDLSENNITGGVPSCFNSTEIQSIRLSKNRLHGPFPMAFQYIPLVELDLSYNQFSGNIPTWIGRLSELAILLLQNNHFEGNIPKELCHLSSLSLIDLSSNNLSGSIIPCISNVKFNGIPREYGFPYFFDNAYSPPQFTLLLQELRMESKGDEMGFGGIWKTINPLVEEVKFATKGMSLIYKGTVLHLFSGINLSHNRLTSPIPPEIGNLTHIKVLNFSHNYLTGTIPKTFSNLKSIECLDLSYNHLSGKIPSQLTELYSLAVFNLSYNNLSGSTPPTVAQFGTFDQSNSYVGNPFLCGEPLPRKCNATYSPPRTPIAAINGSEEDSYFMDMDTFYMSFAGSYITVVLAIVAILFINPYWRRAWFHLLEVFLASSYYFVVDNLVHPVRGFLWK